MPPTPNPNGCCGVQVGCCGQKLPDVLQATISNVANCSCVSGQNVTLNWDDTMQFWSGQGSGTACAAQTITWQLACSGSSASGFGLTIIGNACIAQSITLDSGATCNDPTTGGLNLSFTVSLVGLECCNPNPGSGTVKVKITS